MAIENILIAHYLSNGTLRNKPAAGSKDGSSLDGVSLEMAKRAGLLKSMGMNPLLFSGPKYKPDFMEPMMNLDDPLVKRIGGATVGGPKGLKRSGYAANEGQLLEDMKIVSEQIHESLLSAIRKEHIDLIYAHNVASLGRHIPAAKAFYDVAVETGLPFVLMNHDLYFEGALKANPNFPWVEDMLDQYHLWDLPNARNIVINSINQAKLRDGNGIRSIDSAVNFDVIDFDHPPGRRGNLRERLGDDPNDIYVLHATRIVPNKTIEFAVDFVEQLAAEFLDRSRNGAISLYDGRTFSKDNKIVFVLPNYAEDFAKLYELKIVRKMSKAGINFKFIYNVLQPGDISFWDVYRESDLVTYTSMHEGFGNQWLEAILFKKIVALYEYPVFLADIKPQGYNYVSLGSRSEMGEDGLYRLSDEERLRHAIYQTMDYLTGANLYNESANINFNIGKKNHSFLMLKHYLMQDFNWAESLFTETQTN